MDRRTTPHSRGNAKLRSGVFWFLALTVLLQGVRLGLRPGTPAAMTSPDVPPLMVLRPAASEVPTRDPNRLDDFTGYRLGLSPGALDRLYAFRRAGGILHNPEEMARVAGLADSTLARLRPLLRFPRSYVPAVSRPPANRVKPGPSLNAASAADFSVIRGIGPVLSARIVKFRDALGGFRDPEQLRDVYGLSAELAAEAARRFPLQADSTLSRLDINRASREELGRNPYIGWELAGAIVRFRERNGPFTAWSQITDLPAFGETKYARIRLYLTL